MRISTSYGAVAPLVLVVLRLNTKTHITKYEDREGRHPLLLFGSECLIERLPRIGEPLKVGRSLSQGIGTSIQEGNRITIAHHFERTFVTSFTHRFRDFCEAGLSVLRSSANSVLYSRPGSFQVSAVTRP